MTNNIRRIAVLQDDWFPMPGGGPVSTLELCERLAANYGVKIDIYTRSLVYDGDSYSKNESVSNNINVIRIPPTTEYGDPVGRFAYLITPLLYARKDYDLIHAQCYLPAIPGKLLSWFQDAPIVFTIRGTSIETDSTLGSTEGGVVGTVRKFAEKLVSVNFDYDTVISVNRDFVKRFNNQHNNAVFIPNGVDINKFNSQANASSTKFFFVGRLVGKKRLDILLHAFETVVNNHPDAKLTIAGDGPLRSELISLSEDLKIDNSVEFLGRVPYERIPEIYSQSDVFVLPSEWEGHPRVMLESWASSRPVIGSDVEGISEFIDHGRNGWLVPYDSPDKLAERMNWCVNNPLEVEACGEKSRQLVIEEFSWDAVAKKTIDIYNQLIIQ